MLTTDMGFIFLESQPTELTFKVLPHMIAKKTILWYGKTKKYLLLFLVETAPAAFHEKGKLPDFGAYSCKILSVTTVGLLCKVCKKL
jgi:hypothetical protein